MMPVLVDQASDSSIAMGRWFKFQWGFHVNVRFALIPIFRQMREGVNLDPLFDQ